MYCNLSLVLIVGSDHTQNSEIYQIHYFFLFFFCVYTFLNVHFFGLFQGFQGNDRSNTE